METRYKEFVVENKVLDDGSYEAIITTSVKDRQDEVVLSAGADLTAFMKNPVVLFAHEYDKPPVGRVISAMPEPDRIRTRFLFPEHGVSQRADEVHALWGGGFLNAISIGFIPKVYGAPAPDSIYAQNGVSNVISEWELLEISIVPVPANQEALRLAMNGAEVALKSLSDGTKVTEEHDGEQNAEPSVEVKEGRVLSKANRDLVQSCVDSLNALLEASDRSSPGDEQDEEKAWLDALHKQLMTRGGQ